MAELPAPSKLHLVCGSQSLTLVRSERLWVMTKMMTGAGGLKTWWEESGLVEQLSVSSRRRRGTHSTSGYPESSLNQVELRTVSK